MESRNNDIIDCVYLSQIEEVDCLKETDSKIEASKPSIF